MTHQETLRMARFRDILNGKRARKTIEFPLDGFDPLRRATGLPPGEPGPEAPDHVLVDLVVLLGYETADVLEKARSFAKTRGIESPKEGDSLFDLGVMVHTLLRVCVDHESPEAEVRPFFASEAEVLGSPRDRIAYVFAQHEIWQDQCSPQVGRVSPDALYAIVQEAAASPDPARPFAYLRPGLAAICFRSMALQLVSSPTPKSQPGSSSEAKPTHKPMPEIRRGAGSRRKRA